MPDSYIKKFKVSAYFPDLASGQAYQDWIGEAPTIAKAVYLALRDMRTRQGVAKKHIRSARVTVVDLEHSSPDGTKAR